MPNSSTSRSMRFLCSLACALAFCSSSPRTFADELEEVTPLVTVDELDGDQFRVLSALVPVALGASASGNITNDVAQILSILQSVHWRTSTTDMIRVLPYANGSNYLVTWFAPLFGVSGSNVPNAADGYLYKIQRALYGVNGVPSASDAIQPVLLRMLAAMSAQSNVWTRADVQQALYLVNDIDGRTTDLIYEYVSGSHPDAWDVWLEDMQFSALLSAVGSVSNSVYALGGLLSDGHANVSVDLSPVTDRQDRWYDYSEDVDDAAAYQYASFQNTATSRDREDADLIDDTVDEFEHNYASSPPSMDAYTPASPTEAQDVDKDSLLDALDGDVEHPSRWVLLSSSDAQGSTGQSFEMAVSFNEGRLGTFLSDASSIMSAGWYGLLAAMSAVLFWRKQTEISAIVHGTNFSRV